MTAIGIDLGTNSARVAVWHKRKRAIKIIPNEVGNKSTPAFVAFTNAERLIGDAAKNQVSGPMK
jgi:heat shock 70kDa protein 1/2/6/8